MARQQILPTLDFRTQEQRQGVTSTQQTVQAIAGILQTLGQAEKTRRERKQLDRIATAIAGGATTVEAINAVAQQPVETGGGVQGILQTLGGAFQPQGGGIQQDIQQMIVRSRLKQALQPKVDIPTGFETTGVTVGPGGGVTRRFAKPGVAGKRTRSDVLLEQIDKKVAAGTLKEGSPEHLRLLGASGDKIKTPEDKLRFWQTVLQKTIDAIGTPLEGQEETANLAADKIEEALGELKGEVAPASRATKGINIKTGKPTLSFNREGQVTAIGGEELDAPVPLAQGKAMRDLPEAIKKAADAGVITQEEIQTIVDGLEKDPSKAEQILEIIRKRLSGK